MLTQFNLQLPTGTELGNIFNPISNEVLGWEIHVIQSSDLAYNLAFKNIIRNQEFTKIIPVHNI